MKVKIKDLLPRAVSPTQNDYQHEMIVKIYANISVIAINDSSGQEPWILLSAKHQFDIHDHDIIMGVGLGF